MTSTQDVDLTAGTPVRRREGEPPAAGDYTLLRDVGSTYRDGAESDLLEIVRGTDDIGSLNRELHRTAEGWAQQYHVDRRRANVLRGFDLTGISRVLEIGAGCGAVSRYLAETCPVVDALEPVPARAAVAAARLRDRPGARVFVGEVEDLPDEPGYDLVVVIGVLEYVGNGTADPSPYLAFLEAIRRRLAPGGQLVLAIENKLGVKYLAGSPEDHTNRAYDSLEDYPVGGHARTFDRDELTRLMTEAGLQPEVLAAFPDYKMTRVVMSDDLLEHPSALAARLPRFPSPDWLSGRQNGPNEELLWQTLVAAGQGEQHGNSFVVVARLDDQAPAIWPATQGAAFFSAERLPGRATWTTVSLRDGAIELSRGPLDEPAVSGELAQRWETGPFREGVPLVDVLARADAERSAELLRAWVELLQQEDAADGVALDLVPHNLILTPTDDLVFIDDEWRSASWSADLVVARGLLWLSDRLSARPGRWQGRATRLELLRELAGLLDIVADEEWIATLVRHEAEFQVEMVDRERDEDGWSAAVDRATAELAGWLQQPLVLPHPEVAGLIDERDRQEAELGARQEQLNAQREVLERRAAELAALTHERDATLDRVSMLENSRRELDTAFSALREQTGQLLGRISSVQRELAALEQSRAQQWLGRYRETIERVAPRGSRRRALYQRAGGAVTAAADPGTGAISLATSFAPQLSIVIPVHGKWDYTARCLRSVAAQELDVPFEVVVVDDASPDDTRRQLEQIEGVRVVGLDENVGYLRATNRGCAESRGDYVLMLNNDTELAPAALQSLVDTLTGDPTIGLVGAKLVFPDGTLQEAGGIVFSDASAWNYGRGENPDKPQYNYVRDIDYCSGAAILIRAELLRTIGGLDLRFAPAYYEDTDLAFAVRAAGYRTVYQPKATVVHHESVSHAGSGDEFTFKHFMVPNQVAFMEKWRVELQKRRPNLPGAAELSRDRTPLGRVIVIDHYVPEPDQDSGSVRMHAILGLLRERGHAVTFVPDNRHRSEPYTSDLQQQGIEVFYGDQALEEHLAAMAPEICAVIVSRPSVAWRYMAMLREVLPEAPVFYDTVDLHHQREEARSALEARSGAGITKAWRELELGLVRSCDATFVVSPTEQQVLEQEVPDADIRLLPNVHVPVPDAPGVTGREREILFVGGYRHHPNIDAVQWFVAEVLPLVRRAAPDVRVTVVGSNPPPAITELDGNGVDVLGWVQDLDPLLARARVFIAPLRYGAGIKGKVGQSLSHGLPVVTTSVGADGMGLENGVHARVADDAEGFAAAIVDLLDDDAQWQALAAAGRALVDERFGPTAVGRLLDEAFVGVGVDRTRGRD